MALVPYVIEQTGNGERSMDIFSRLLNDRIIVLSDEVNSQTASLVVAQLLFLEGQDNEKDISLPAMHDDMYGEIALFVKLLENGKKESDVMTYAASINIAIISDMIRIPLNNNEHCVNMLEFEKK